MSVLSPVLSSAVPSAPPLPDPVPIAHEAVPSFAGLGVSADLVARLEARGLTSPFPIQRATIPDGLAGRDVCGRAPTGSGKTLAFGVVVATRAVGAKSRRPAGLVLVPTRELAAQVQRELAGLAGDRGRRVVAVYGGTGYGDAQRALNRGVDVLVACPGRLEDSGGSGRGRPQCGAGRCARRGGPDG